MAQPVLLAEVSSGGWALIPMLGTVVVAFVATGLLAGWIAGCAVGRPGRDEIVLPAIGAIVTMAALAKSNAFSIEAVPVIVGLGLLFSITLAGVQRVIVDRFAERAAVRALRSRALRTAVGAGIGVGIALGAGLISNDNGLLGQLLAFGGSLGALIGVLFGGEAVGPRRPSSGGRAPVAESRPRRR